MFLLFEVASQSLIPGFIPESLGLLIFGVVLVLFAIGLRRFMKHDENKADGEVIHRTK